MNDPTRLLRTDLRGFVGYASARRTAVSGTTWLNANEAPVANAADPGAELRRYPDPQPPALVQALADLYGVAAEQVLACRGSDEAIDLLVRACCRPGRDAIVTAPPTFGMYAVSARLHGTGVLEVPARDDADGFRVDLAAVGDVARARKARLVFLCSPGNPTGEALDGSAVLALARSLAGRALVVVDEAYVEFGDAPSLAGHVRETPNLVVLRTLSKAHALAGARIGCALADPRVVAALARCQAPYPIPAPSRVAALAALQGDALRSSWDAIARLREERARLFAALGTVRGVRKVYPSAANFLLVRCDDAEAVWTRLLGAGVVVRDLRAEPRLADALRISVGSRDDNTLLLEALA